MKTFVKCAFVAAFLATTLSAQSSLVPPDATGYVPDVLTTGAPALTSFKITESATAWNFDLVHGVPSHFVALVVGDRAGAGSIDLGIFGRMDLLVTEPQIVAFVGPTNGKGDLSFDILKPSLVSPALEGLTIQVQCVGIDYTLSDDPSLKAPVYLMNYVPSEVAELTIHAVLDLYIP